jgi:hypothetical protein
MSKSTISTFQLFALIPDAETITTHPRHKIAHRWRIEVGDPSEGSLYKVRAA